MEYIKHRNITEVIKNIFRGLGEGTDVSPPRVAGGAPIAASLLQPGGASRWRKVEVRFRSAESATMAQQSSNGHRDIAAVDAGTKNNRSHARNCDFLSRNSVNSLEILHFLIIYQCFLRIPNDLRENFLGAPAACGVRASHPPCVTHMGVTRSGVMTARLRSGKLKNVSPRSDEAAARAVPPGVGQRPILRGGVGGLGCPGPFSGPGDPSWVPPPRRGRTSCTGRSRWA